LADDHSLHKVTVFLGREHLEFLDHEALKLKYEARDIKAQGGEAEVNVNRSFVLRKLIDECARPTTV
jgi:hypothetical protein